MPEPSLHPTHGYLPSELDAMRKQEGLPSIEDLVAGNTFRDALVRRADGHDEMGAPLWFGWAVMDAFIAGAEYVRKQQLK